jgi:hypothetical protein
MIAAIAVKQRKLNLVAKNVMAAVEGETNEATASRQKT